MPVNVDALQRLLMDRLEQAARIAASNLVTTLKTVVTAGAEDGTNLRKPASGTPFLFVEEDGTVRRRRVRGTRYRREGPPGVRSGDGMRSICYEIRGRYDTLGVIVVRIGVDNSAPGGTRQLQSYMLAHDLGIRYPTRGGPGVKGTGPLIQRPWLRNGVRHYLPEFTSIITNVIQQQ